MCCLRGAWGRGSLGRIAWMDDAVLTSYRVGCELGGLAAESFFTQRYIEANPDLVGDTEPE